jgi:hypothetical protein
VYIVHTSSVIVLFFSAVAFARHCTERERERVQFDVYLGSKQMQGCLEEFFAGVFVGIL